MAERRSQGQGGDGDAARLLLAAARERFSVAATDLLLPSEARLTEWQRLTAAALLIRLVRTIEDALRARLAEHFADHDGLHAAFSSAHVAIAQPVLERAQVLRDAELGTVLVRRVEEHRFWKENARSDDGSEEYLLDLVRDHDAGIASDAMALMIARSRRFDQFNEPVMGETELPAEIQHRLVWMIAAALRQYMVQQHGLASGRADAAIAAVAGELIASYDEGASLEACSVRLARRLARAGRLDDAVLQLILEDGLLPLFIAAIGVRAGLDYPAAWEVLSDPRGRGPALLLRAAEVERDQAAGILLVLNSRGRMFSGAEGNAAARQLDLFEATDEAAARDVLRLWQVDPGYRAAVARLSTRARSVAEAA
ncbi:DUF2336 domain-containing protein [Sphingosinicella humi]|uniref:DUF2336 domain-containing protein n=1 Tax=Allosphingosinicella humi TaxID=2068657 RepID=A0A2U2J4Z9_9SPHN|nr:DUF2336 domain-containing protein [Sphingosinicella humi]PWG03405.1 hypothetical protein DF286_11395 [Sphingosinicella humi]